MTIADCVWCVDDSEGLMTITDCLWYVDDREDL